jgi:hypothetical protein
VKLRSAKDKSPAPRAVRSESRLLRRQCLTGGATMRGKRIWRVVLAAFVLLCAASVMSAQNQIMGKIDFAGATRVEKASGVWVDGQYVGYLKELKGKKKIVLLPGKHEISVRQNGYADFTQQLTVEPGQTQLVSVRMEKAEGVVWPSTTAALKLNVEPERAAVFVDDAFIGHAGELGGFHAMLLSPGKHRIKIALPGYQTFDTEVNLLVGQKAEVKTELVKGSIEQAGPLIVARPGQENAER